MAEHSGRPKYEEVATALRRAIAAGTYPVESALPSTAQLMNQFEVSSTVVRAAIRELRNEGIVVGQPGKAVFVRGTPSSDERTVEERLDELSTHMHDELASLRDRIAALERER